jgi:imidazolonepropionase-like amidohydrolase
MKRLKARHGDRFAIMSPMASIRESLMLANRHTTQLAILAALIASAPGATSEPPATWALKAAKLYVAPDSRPIENGAVLVRDGKIAAVGAGEAVIPEGTPVSECSGGIVTAGFQNSHVHFVGKEFANARNASPPALKDALTSMLTRFGYTTVVDTATFDRDNSLALRARIDSGEVPGPRILTVGLPLFPPQGIPVYLSHFPKELRERLPQPDTAKAAVQVVRDNVGAGTHATKLFVATPTDKQGTVKRMPPDIARAAVDETHRHKQLAIAHPTDIDGVRAAIAADVDILAHTTLGAKAPWPDDVLQQFVDADMAMMPTLQLLGYELKKDDVPEDKARQIVGATIDHFRAFVAAGGRVIFGTDVGYMTDHDPTQEYALMAQAGMSPMRILASLTTEPAKAWRESERHGKLVAGMDADIVVLDADPAADPRNFAKVRCAFRQGRAIYRASGE